MAAPCKGLRLLGNPVKGITLKDLGLLKHDNVSR